MVPTAYSQIQSYYPEAVKTKMLELNSARFFDVEPESTAVSIWLTTTDHGNDEVVLKLKEHYETHGYLPSSSMKRAVAFMSQPQSERVEAATESDVKLEAARQVSCHFGTLGEKMVGSFELLKVFKNRRRGWDAHGATYIFSSLEPETQGWQFVYRGTSSVLKRLPIGGTFILSGDISGHSQYEGILQTEFVEPRVLGGEMPEHHSEQVSQPQPETRWIQVKVDQDGNPDMSSYQSEVYKTNSRKRGGRKHNRHLYRKSA
jgi:hypothetical protein